MSGPDDHRTAVDGVGFWWHSIDLGDGLVTPGVKTPEVLAAELATMDVPDLDGRTVLDVGGWDGFFAFDAERRGAREVAVLDHYVWSIDLPAQQEYWRTCAQRGVTPDDYETTPFWRPDDLPGRAGFDVARAALGSGVRPIVRDFTRDDLTDVGTWDVVYFLGVLYHLHDPFAALRKLRALTREVAVIETHAIVVHGHEGTGLWRFFPGSELNGDPSNWWAPTLDGLTGMLLAAGFDEVDVKRGPLDGEHEFRAVVHARVAPTVVSSAP